MADRLAENLVEAIAEALGVDSDHITEDRFNAACKVVQDILAQGNPLPGDAEAKLRELAQAVRVACHHVNNGLTPLYAVDNPDPGVIRAAGAMKDLAKVNKQVAR